MKEDLMLGSLDVAKIPATTEAERKINELVDHINLLQRKNEILENAIKGILNSFSRPDVF